MIQARIPFSKYVACGNDFILIDHRDPFLTLTQASIRNLCDRHRGIGADGIILLEKSSKADWKMRIFNADGSEAEMCGNGIRCLIKFLMDLGQNKGSFEIETMENILSLQNTPDGICVKMGEVKEEHLGIKLIIERKEYQIDLLNTGVPHAVVLVDDVQTVDLATIGPKIRHHPFFQPHGANSTFASYDGQKLHVRTYERGVEGETLGCGTGVAAACVAASKKFYLPEKIPVKTRSGELLYVTVSPLTLFGGASFVFHGQFPKDSLKIEDLWLQKKKHPIPKLNPPSFYAAID
jgi:diaminopimelate epimerase